MILCVVSSVISRRNSGWVSGRAWARWTSEAIGWISASCSSRCGSVISTGTRVSVRGGSWSRTSCRTRRTMHPRSLCLSVSRWRTPVISRRPSARTACTAPSRHFGSSAMSSTHSTIDASSSTRFSIGVPVSTSRYGGASPLTDSAVLVAQFLILCASSSTTRSGAQRRIVSRSRINCS